jgi:glycosyltransferase involved in cell wall biosynthesis
MRVLFSRVKYYRYFGMDGLCVMFGRSLRRLHRVEKIIFYAIDFVPADRFGNTVKDKIYHWVNINSYKKSDEMWDLSPRMAEAREKYLNVMEKDYKLHRVVEHGMWPNRVKKCSYEECKKNTLVFMGHLVEKQGVQLVIRSIPEIIKKIPEFRFKIIGGGSYSKELIKLAESEHVEKYCQFLGKIENIETVEHEIAISCVAIAPYIRALDTFTYYADPGKVKTYLACGVPVLLTDIPWNAKEIEDNLCGKIIDENTASVVDAVAFLMNEAINKKFRINAIAYSHKFDYGKVLADLI